MYGYCHSLLQVGVQITLSSNGLTKIIECSPYYVLVNQSNSSISFTEQVTGGSSVMVPPHEVSNREGSAYILSCGIFKVSFVARPG